MSETQQAPETKPEVTTPVTNGLNGSPKPESVETKTPTTEAIPEKTAEDKRIASRFAALSKRDKETIARAQQVAEKERALAAREAEIKEQIAEVERVRGLKQKAKEDPASFLAEGGLDYNYLTQYYLNNGKRPPEDVQQEVFKELKQELTGTKEEIEALKKSQQDAVKAQQQKEIQKTVEWFAGEVEKTYKDENAYPFTKLMEGTGIIFDIAAKKLIEENEIIDPSVVAPELERYYEEQWEEMLKNSAVVEKFNKLHAPKAKEEESKAKETNFPPRYIRPKTISNSQVLSDPNASLARPLTQEERFQRALAVVKRS